MRALTRYVSRPPVGPTLLFEAFHGLKALPVQTTKLAIKRKAKLYTLHRPAQKFVTSNSSAHILQDIRDVMVQHAGLLQAFTKAFLMVRVCGPTQQRAVQYHGKALV